MTQKKRILVLTADAGYGHRSAAKAIVRTIDEHYADSIQVDMVNPLNDKRTPRFLTKTQYDYDKTVRNAPELYQLGYEMSDSPVPATMMESVLTVTLYETIRMTVKTYRPDLIITTYPLYLAPLDTLFTMTPWDIPVVTVVTDLGPVHRIWFSTVSNATVVPAQAGYDQAVSYGLSSESVKVIGIPVNPQIAAEERNKKTLRRELGWNPDLTTLLVVGSKRSGDMSDALRILNHANLPIQLALVAGGDDDFHTRLQQTDWHRPAQVYNFVENLPTMMHAADAIMCKAGGLIVTESLACGLPLILVDVIPGQEEGNAAYVTDSGAGELATDPITVLEILHSWLAADAALLKVRAAHAARVGKPRAALDTVELSLKLMGTEAHKPRAIKPRKQTRLTELLENFNIPWRESV